MLGIALVGLAATAALAVAAPELLAQLCAKEGPLEQLSHWVLAAAVLAWIRHALRARDDRPWALLVSLWLLLVLGEEIDWGGVYYFNDIADYLRARVGHRNLHNALDGLAYTGFALLTAALLLYGVLRARARALAGRPTRGPTRDDALGLGLLALVTTAVTLALPRLEATVEECAELLFYAGMLWIALRPVFLASGSRSIKLHTPTQDQPLS